MSTDVQDRHYDVVFENYDYHLGKDADGRSLEETFKNTDNINSVKMLHCAFESFPHEQLDLDELTALSVYRCSFEGEPVCADVGKYTNLEYLCLSECGFKVFPSGIITLSRLQKLLLGNSRRCPGKWKNALSFLPKCLADLKSLEHLDISWCMLPSCPEVLNKLTNLKHLTLSGNFYIEALSTSLLQSLSKLEHLDVTYCGLSKCPHFPSGMTSLKYLNMSVNEITSVNDSLKNLTNLETLDLSSCELSKFSDVLADMDSLVHLNLSANPISVVTQSVGNLTHLIYLDMSNCDLSTFPKDLLSVISLRHLDLSQNGIETIPESIGQLKNLQMLKVLESELNQLISDVSPRTKLDVTSNKLSRTNKGTNKIKAKKLVQI